MKLTPEQKEDFKQAVAKDRPNRKWTLTPKGGKTRQLDGVLTSAGGGDSITLFAYSHDEKLDEFSLFATSDGLSYDLIDLLNDWAERERNGGEVRWWTLGFDDEWESEPFTTERLLDEVRTWSTRRW